jgi:hypothetical protein
MDKIQRQVLRYAIELCIERNKKKVFYLFIVLFIKQIFVLLADAYIKQLITEYQRIKYCNENEKSFYYARLNLYLNKLIKRINRLSRWLSAFRRMFLLLLLLWILGMTIEEIKEYWLYRFDEPLGVQGVSILESIQNDAVNNEVEKYSLQLSNNSSLFSNFTKLNEKVDIKNILPVKNIIPSNLNDLQMMQLINLSKVQPKVKLLTNNQPIIIDMYCFIPTTTPTPLIKSF